MELKKNIKKILAITGMIVFVGATLTGCISQEDLDNAYKEGAGSVVIPDIESDNEQVKTDAIASVDITSDNQAAADKAVQDYKDSLVVADAEDDQDDQDDQDNKEGYLIDELEIGAEFTEILSDREVNGLFDGEVKFDGDDYDAEEVISITGTVSVNEKDYDGKSYLQIDEDGISYELRLDNDLDTSEIDEDETLEITVACNKVEISDWDVDEVTFTEGEVITFKGEKTTITTLSGYTVTVNIIEDDEASVTIGKETKHLKVGNTKEIDGVEVHLESAMANEAGDLGEEEATLKVGKDVLVEVEDGDEYAKDSIWNWKITPNSIGLVLNEEHTYIDEDEDYKALAAGENISLPNDCITFSYNGLAEEEEVTLDFDLAKDDQYVRVKGEFEKGIKDYNKIYINQSGIYDDDLDLIDVTDIKIANTDDGNGDELVLELNAPWLELNDIEIRGDLERIKVDGDLICDFDETFVTEYGISIHNPEDGCEDSDFKVTIPEEKSEASVTVAYK